MTEIAVPIFYAGNVPAGAVSTYVPQDRPYRIAVEGWTVVGMNSAAQTTFLSFASREGAECVLPAVQEQIPDATIEELAPDA